MKTYPKINVQAWFDDLIDHLIELETWSSAELVVKLSEESGELSEQVLASVGKKQKVFDEPIEGEVADVINCAIAIHVRVLMAKGFSPQQIKTKLYEGIAAKNLKYVNALAAQRK